MPTIFISNRHSSEPHDFSHVAWPSDPDLRNQHLGTWATTYDNMGVGRWSHRNGYDAYVSMTPAPLDVISLGGDGTVIPAVGCFDVVTHSTPGLQFYCDPNRHAYNTSISRWEPGCGRTISLTGSQTHHCSPCDRCRGYTSNLHHVESTDHGTSYNLCDVCYDYLTYDKHCLCTHCERVLSVNEGETISFGNEDGRWCENCVDEYTYTCDVCGDAYDRDGGEYCEHCESCDACSDYCLEMHQEGCGAYQREENNGLQEYHFTPFLTFHGDTRAGQALFMGVELEVDEHRNRDTGYPDISSFLEDARRLLTPIQRTHNVDDNGLFYFKEDGSLRNGVEIVSNPATLQFHMDHMPWRSIMDIAKDNMLFGHNTDTAGLHIHVSRTGLGISKAEQEYTLAKLVMLMWRVWPELFAFSRRTENTMNQWASPNHMFVPDVNTCDCVDKMCNYCMSNLAYDLIKRGNESVSKFTQQKYTAVNTRPRDTLEFRLWRSTLKYGTFMATMQLTKLLIDMSMKFDISYLGHVDWEDLLSQAADHEYAYLWDYATSPEIREKMELVRHRRTTMAAYREQFNDLSEEATTIQQRLGIADTVAAADILYQQTINAYTATIN